MQPSTPGVRLSWSIVITVLAAAQLLVANHVETTLLSAATLGFLLIGPGMAFVQLLQMDDRLFETVLALLLSLVLDLLVAATVLYTGFWSPRLILMILVYLSLVGVACQLWLWHRARAKRTLGQTL